MTIFRLIKDSAFGPYQIKVMTEAYEATLKALHLKAGTEPINELIAKKIIGIVQANEHDPKRICARTIKELGIQDLANSQKFREGSYARAGQPSLGVPRPRRGPPRSIARRMNRRQLAANPSAALAHSLLIDAQ